jgi:hypothetical protein
MNSLLEERPVRAYNFHYGEAFTEPANRPEPVRTMQDYIEIWRRRTPLMDVTAKANARKNAQQKRWADLAQRIRDIVLIEGHGPGSEIAFVDYIPGPRLMEAYPLEPFPEGEKLRARFVAQNPEMEAVIAKRRTDEINSVQH